ncbi:MAG: histidine phosphatase family protein [Acidobacteria bacterium]|nr:histidine phosphatase family protein [Acidobacteriota bacterium]
MIARHGEPEMMGVLLGQADPGLSDHGRRQAAELAEEWKTLRIERLVSSKLRRARETALVVGRALGLDVDVDGRLNEISYGVWDGREWADIEASDPGTARRKIEDWWSATPEGGETGAAFYARVEEVWHSLRTRPESVIATVTHTAVNAVLLDLARRSVYSAGDSGGTAGIGPDWRGIQTFSQELGSFLSVGMDSQRQDLQ